MKTKIVIAGATGRMGHALLQGVFEDESLQLYGALDRPGSPILAVMQVSKLVKILECTLAMMLVKRYKAQMF